MMMMTYSRRRFTQSWRNEESLSERRGEKKQWWSSSTRELPKVDSVVVVGLSLSLCVVALFLASKLTTISSSSSGAAKTVTTEWEIEKAKSISTLQIVINCTACLLPSSGPAENATGGRFRIAPQLLQLCFIPIPNRHHWRKKERWRQQCWTSILLKIASGKCGVWVCMTACLGPKLWVGLAWVSSILTSLKNSGVKWR